MQVVFGEKYIMFIAETRGEEVEIGMLMNQYYMAAQKQKEFSNKKSRPYIESVFKNSPDKIFTAAEVISEARKLGLVPTEKKFQRCRNMVRRLWDEGFVKRIILKEGKRTGRKGMPPKFAYKLSQGTATR